MLAFSEVTNDVCEVWGTCPQFCWHFLLVSPFKRSEGENKRAFTGLLRWAHSSGVKNVEASSHCKECSKLQHKARCLPMRVLQTTRIILQWDPIELNVKEHKVDWTKWSKTEFENSTAGWSRMLCGEVVLPNPQPQANACIYWLAKLNAALSSCVSAWKISGYAAQMLSTAAINLSSKYW